MVGLLCAILSFDPSQSLMPYIVNAIKTCDNLRVKPARVAWGAAGTYVLCLGVAIVVVIWSNYNWGVRRHPFITGGVPQMTFKAADTAVTKIKQAEQLEESQLLGPVERLMRIKPEKRFAWSAGLGFAAVLIFSAMRLRFPWWPVHPVMFLMWATWPLHRMGTSFLFGWVIRTVVVRIGGYNGYRAGKPFMVGAVAGDLVGAGLWMTVGVIYYGATGLRPDTIWVFEH
jgi:hypothetical protein